MRNLILILGILAGWIIGGLPDAWCQSPDKASEPPAENSATSYAEVTDAASPDDKQEGPRARNVILMIGDGMGPQQLGLLFAYTRHAAENEGDIATSAIQQLAAEGSIALVQTAPHGALVVDSAAAATQLATGQHAGSEMIGTNVHGHAAMTVIEIAGGLGKATGIVSDTRLTHATPAAFAAHQPHRSMENEIAVDMLESQVDVLLSGGLRHWIPQGVNKTGSAAYVSIAQLISGVYEPNSKRTDNRNLLLEARADYQLVFDRTALERLVRGRVLGLFANSEMLDAMGEKAALDAQDRTEPTLAEMTVKALELLEQDSDGFFLMVEGGQIDWAGHNNDSGTLLAELLRFDRAVQTVLEWAKDRDDTLVLITADHETGAFGFSYSGAEIPAPQRLSGDVFQDHQFAPDFNFGRPEVLDHLAAQKRSFFQIFGDFDALPADERTPEKLLEIVNEGIHPFSISFEDATEILNRAPNRFYTEDHPFLGTKTLPRMPDQQAFYVYGENLRMNRLGHMLSEQQSTVWGTGTHTNTPVVLIAHGPESNRFSGILHSTDVGARMIELVEGN